MPSYKLLIKFSKVAIPLILPFIILTILTPVTNIPLYINLFCIVFAILIALLIIYRLNLQTVVIQFKNKALFISELDFNLQKIGYLRINHKGNSITYCGTPETILFAEDIVVRIQNGKALITAPRLYLKRLIDNLPLTCIHLVDRPALIGQPNKTKTSESYLHFHLLPVHQEIRTRRLV